MARTTKIACAYCKKLFDMEVRYYNRNQKVGRNSFCSRSCVTSLTLASKPHLKLNVTPGGHRLDKYSPFRKYYTCARSRCKSAQRDFTITLQDLHDKWDEQNGCCALSGIKLSLPRTSGESSKWQPFAASLDRKDSTKGYTPENIQWVCLMGQFAKNTFSTEDLVKFCKEVAKKNQ